MTTIRPEITALTATYWEYAKRGVIMLQRCEDDGHVWHPPQPSCPECNTANWTWVPSKGEGSLHSYAVVRHAAHAAVIDRLPYTVCLVRLNEGPLYLCNLMQSAEERRVVGARVELVLGPSLAGFDLPQARISVSRLP
jgi:uncharacterized OB-fold protein